MILVPTVEWTECPRDKRDISTGQMGRVHWMAVVQKWGVPPTSLKPRRFSGPWIFSRFQSLQQSLCQKKTAQKCIHGRKVEENDRENPQTDREISGKIGNVLKRWRTKNR